MSQIKVRICVGMNCSFQGSLNLLDALCHDELVPECCAIEEVRCFGDACEGGAASPVVEVDGELLTSARLQQVMDLILERCRRVRAGAEEPAHG